MIRRVVLGLALLASAAGLVANLPHRARVCSLW